jgi:hypothetical protein
MQLNFSFRFFRGRSSAEARQSIALKDRTARVPAPAVYLLLLLSVPSAFGTNSVTIFEATGSTQTNRPVTISRVFAKGEIANYPQPSIGGTALATWQTNVLSHWPDGSVKHALITFSLTLSANSSTTVAFVNATNPCYLGDQAACDAAAPTQSQILNFNSSNWDADIETTAPGVSGPQTTDIRTMIGAGYWRFWVKGPLMNQIIAEDRSSNLTYDYGYAGTSGSSTWSLATSASQKSLHPIFFLTEYTGYAGEQIEYILENPWISKLQAQVYSVALKSGSGLATTKYTKSSYTMPLGTRWRKVYWDASGSTPGAINIDFNLPYMISTMALPNWDTSITLTPQVVADEYSWAYSGKYVGVYAHAQGWAPSDQCDLGGTGEWDPTIDEPGGRPDLGMFPRWNVSSLYAMMQQPANWPELNTVSMGNAECSAYVPMVHLRESTTGLWYDPGHTTDAFGHSVSRYARPSLATNLQWDTTNLTQAGPIVWGPFSNADIISHMPNFAYLPYLLTGDWYWLEELDYWAAYTHAYGNPAVVGYCQLCSMGSWAFLGDAADQSRGQAWGMEALANAWFLAPDSSIAPEGPYFRTVIDSNIAIREGELNVTNGNYHSLTADATGTSATSVTVGTGSQTFTTQSGLYLWTPSHGISTGAGVQITSTGSGAYMQGTVTSYSGTTLVVNVTATSGSGSHSDWNITSNSRWWWGRTSIGLNYSNPLYFLEPSETNNSTAQQPPIDNTLTCFSTAAPWMHNLTHMIYGRADEMGLTEIHTLRTTIAAELLGQLDDSNYDPFLAGEYHFGENQTYDGNVNDCPTGLYYSSTPFTQLFSTWAQVKATYMEQSQHATNNCPTTSPYAGCLPYQLTYWNSNLTDPEFGYPNIVRAATSYMSTLTASGYSGATAWTWVTANASEAASGAANNPKWAIVPRSASPSTGQLNPCDVNDLGVVNVVDLQSTINQAIGAAPCTTADITGNGQCNVVDVQIVVNAILTGTCTP